ELWKGLRSIGMVERECVEGENRSAERRYFIYSMPADAKRFACLRCAVTGVSRTACTGGWMSYFGKMWAASVRATHRPS
ncbi:MAG: hypothetical protein ACRERU_20975, partial [Methylococcales bacterium]